VADVDPIDLGSSSSTVSESIITYVRIIFFQKKEKAAGRTDSVPSYAQNKESLLGEKMKGTQKKDT